MKHFFMAVIALFSLVSNVVGQHLEQLDLFKSTATDGSYEFIFYAETSIQVTSVNVACPGGKSFTIGQQSSSNGDVHIEFWEDVDGGAREWDYEHLNMVAGDFVSEGYLKSNFTTGEKVVVTLSLLGGGTEVIDLSSEYLYKQALPVPNFTSPTFTNNTYSMASDTASLNLGWNNTAAAAAGATRFSIYMEKGDLELNNYGPLVGTNQSVSFTNSDADSTDLEDGLWEVELMSANLDPSLSTSDRYVGVISFRDYELIVGTTYSISGDIGYTGVVPDGAVLRVNFFENYDEQNYHQDWVGSVEINNPSFPVSYSKIGFTAGTYYCHAWLDLDGDDQYDQGEPGSDYKAGGQSVTGIEIVDQDLTGIDITIPGPAVYAISGTVVNNSGQSGDVILVLSTDASVSQVVGTPTMAGVDGAYLFDRVLDGSYFVNSFVDFNGNGIWDEREAYSQVGPVTVTGSSMTGVDLTIQNFAVSVTSSGEGGVTVNVSDGDLVFDGTSTTSGAYSKVKLLDNGAEKVQAILEIPSGNDATTVELQVQVGYGYEAVIQLRAISSVDRELRFLMRNNEGDVLIGSTESVSSAVNVSIEVVDGDVVFSSVSPLKNETVDDPVNDFTFVSASVESYVEDTGDELSALVTGIDLTATGSRLVLNEGWNLISVPYILSVGFDNFLRDADGSSMISSAMFMWDSSKQLYEIVKFDDITEMQGVWVYSNYEGVFVSATMSGSSVTQSYSFNIGWNLVGMVEEVGVSETPALSGITDAAWGWSGTQYFSVDEELNQPSWQKVGKLMQGHAYWIFSLE